MSFKIKSLSIYFSKTQTFILNFLLKELLLTKSPQFSKAYWSVAEF